MCFDATVLMVLSDSVFSKLVPRISHVWLHRLACQMWGSRTTGMLISFPFDLKTSFPGIWCRNAWLVPTFAPAYNGPPELSFHTPLTQCWSYPMTGHDDIATIAGESFPIFASFVSFTGHWLYCVADGILGSCMLRFGNVPDILSAILYSLLKPRALVWFVYFSRSCWQRLHSTGILFSAASELVTKTSQKITTSIFEVVRQGRETSFKHRSTTRYHIPRDCNVNLGNDYWSGVLYELFFLSVILLHDN